MITVHEFGHYVAGKILNFKINEFSIGFGPAIFKRRSKKTGELFAIRVIPLGGYCAFDGEDGLEEEQKEETVQPPLFEKMPLETEETAILQQTGEGLLVGDVIKKVDGKNVYMITDYMDILNGRKQGDVVPILVLRGAEEITVDMILRVDANIVNMSDTNTLLTAMGVNSMYAVTEREGFFPTIGHSLVYSVKIGGTVLRSLGELLTGKLGLDSMGGPITTIQVTSQAASSGLMSFLNIAAFIGVNLAVFNLLPIPALDGCKVIFCIIEWIRKKPVNRNVEAMIHFIGIIFLFGFAILVDLLQLF
jgi:regulator of sigma E protease